MFFSSEHIMHFQVILCLDKRLGRLSMSDGEKVLLSINLLFISFTLPWHLDLIIFYSRCEEVLILSSGHCSLMAEFLCLRGANIEGNVKPFLPSKQHEAIPVFFIDARMEWLMNSRPGDSSSCAT